MASHGSGSADEAVPRLNLIAAISAALGKLGAQDVDGDENAVPVGGAGRTQLFDSDEGVCVGRDADEDAGDDAGDDAGKGADEAVSEDASEDAGEEAGMGPSAQIPKVASFHNPSTRV